jgi:hypothetical protein
MSHTGSVQTEAAPELVRRYRQDGFVVVEGLLDPAELEEWRREVDEAVAQRLEDRGAPLQNQADPESYYAQIFTQCLRLADSHEGVRRRIYDPGLAAMAGQLSGAEGLRVWHDQALYKPPFGNPTAWHLDNPYWSFDSDRAVSVWIALDDATRENGCLYYLPGTHKSARFDNVPLGNNQADLFRHYPEWRSIEPACAACKAGDAVFHHGLVAHGAGANMTNRPRRAMTCAYMPDGSVFNGKQNVLPQEYFESLTIGDLLANDDINPLLWRK